MLAREVSRVVQTDARERYFRINQLRNARGGGGTLFQNFCNLTRLRGVSFESSANSI